MNTKTYIIEQVLEQGYAFLPGYQPHVPTGECVGQFSTIVKLPFLEDVQLLKPRQKQDSRLNTYSGNYGKEAFPLHSDLAHWILPPQYFVLRCVSGDKNVKTRLLDSRSLIERIGAVPLKRALVVPRRPIAGSRFLLRLLEYRNRNKRLIRWDTLFISPATPETRATFTQVSGLIANACTREIALANPGDTLVVDNWRMLHGRSFVADGLSKRHVERAYLRDLK